MSGFTDIAEGYSITMPQSRADMYDNSNRASTRVEKLELHLQVPLASAGTAHRMGCDACLNFRTWLSSLHHI